ncbi:MAG: polysaccharide deacetylase, partial [Deltaproteobacteria bacterium]|nr:polysaccharide deacetylase [Deltaproteobacteria bacterium]
VQGSLDALEAAVGVRPVGFRAPGYALSPGLYQVLCDAGLAYDSSTFPAAPYYAAKAAVMGGLALLGRPSRSVLDRPRVLAAPTLPYRPDPAEPYARGGGQVLELPVAVSPGLRVPFIGTLAVAAPWPVVRHVYGALRGSNHLNFELHAVDLLGSEDALPGPLLRQQRDLSIRWVEKRERLHQLFTWMRRDFDVVTLRDAAAQLAPTL